jgi:hypothetical protein
MCVRRSGVSFDISIFYGPIIPKLIVIEIALFIIVNIALLVAIGTAPALLIALIAIEFLR